MKTTNLRGYYQWETLLFEVNQGKGAEQDAYKARLKEIDNRQSHILSAIENGMYNVY